MTPLTGWVVCEHGEPKIICLSKKDMIVEVQKSDVETSEFYKVPIKQKKRKKRSLV